MITYIKNMKPMISSRKTDPNQQSLTYNKDPEIPKINNNR